MTAKEFLDVMKQAEDYNPAMTPLIVKYGEMLLQEKLAAAGQVNLVEVEKIVQICGNYMESYRKENKSDWVKGVRFAIGYKLSDIPTTDCGQAPADLPTEKGEGG